ncbi:MAG TPA: insulinase family protein [Anaerolineales bacterium]|nr:insulinase family protein [Anaerolineales bacterium]
MSKKFNLLQEQEIPELNAIVKYYTHKKTGARLLSVINDDENKVFAISFRTPPKNSTGVAHILEHCVLNGSEKYPVKEPFVELLKGSLATFVNAFTYPDKTCYPVASQNVQDFYNLIDVYVDAVFHPLIAEQTFMQEGWHYELNDPAEPLIYKGVVFNEMKGAYSSPERVLETAIFNSLFPKHVYGVDSGGNPRNIPDLSYEDFKAFHTSYYHPSNSFIFFYGNDDPDKRLELMEEYLKPYKKLRIKSKIPLKKPFKRARKVKYTYDAGQDTDIKKKHYFTVNWVLPDTSDPVMNFSLRILGHILIGTPASPLKKALLDSGLGEDLAGAGLESELHQIIFSTGLKGTHARAAKKIEALIFETLESLVRDGIDPDMIAAALNTIDFRLRENNTGAFPRGISLMLRSLTTWLHEDDPIKLLAFEAPLNAVKDKLSDNERYFEELIQTHLIDNQHRTLLRLIPDPELAARFEEEEKNRLADIRESLTESQLKEIVEGTQKLKERQETPDTEETLASIPVLKLADLEKESRTIPIDVMDIQNTKVLHHDLFTNGILYLDLGFDLHALPKDLLPLTNVLSRALLEMGTETEDYVKLSQRIGKSTGGIHGSSVTSAVIGSGESVAKMFIRGKATVEQSSELLSILKDVLLKTNFDNKERLKQIILEEKASLEAGLVPSGHIFVNRRLRAQFNEAGWAQDQMSGIGYLFALRDLEKGINRRWPSILKKLVTMRDALINQNAMLCNVTVDSNNWNTFKPQLDSFLSALPSKDAKLSAFNFEATQTKEGLIIPAQVNYVGKGINLYDMGYEQDGSAMVVNGYLRMSYLWEKIRVQGGAYGGFSAFDDVSGVFTFLSYRDPNVVSTIKNYDKAGAFLKSLDASHLSDNELTKAIIAAIGDLDSYQLPDAKGYTSMMRYLTGRSDEMRQKIRDQVLSTNGEDFIAFGEMLEKVPQSESVTVIGSQSALDDSGLGLKITKVL